MTDQVAAVLTTLVPGGIRRRETLRAGRRLSWVEAGHGDPPVVLDAGHGDTGTMAWGAVLPVLATVTRVIAYDRAGYGSSEPTVPLTVAQQVGDLAALIESFQSGPVVVAGHSWGGLIAQLLAGSRPGLVAGLVLVDPAVGEGLPGRSRLQRLRDSQAERVLLVRELAGRRFRDSMKPAADECAARVTDDPDVRRQFSAAYRSCYGLAQVRAILAEGRASTKGRAFIRAGRARGRLPAIPVTILSATTGSRPATRQAWTQLQAAIITPPAYGEHRVIDSGHAMQWERPDVVADAIASMIGQLRVGSGPTGITVTNEEPRSRTKESGGQGA
jgi:pimeloyl-ACP methyl ester carboxylesterase